MFPTTLPLAAFQALAKFFVSTTKDWGAFSLAVWQLVGFGLGKAFPNAALLTGAAPELHEIAAAIPADTMSKLVTADEAQLAAMSPELEALLATLGPMLLKWALKKLGIPTA